MNNGIIKIYALSLCFVSITCGAITAVFLIYNLIKYSIPESTIDPNQLTAYSSNEEFRKSISSPPIAIPGAFTGPVSGSFAPSEARNYTDKEITKMRNKKHQETLVSHKFQAKQGITLQIIIMLTCITLYLPHWKLAKTKRSQ